MNIVIPDKIQISSDALEKIQQLPANTYEDVPTDEAVIIERVKDAEIITANYIDITPAIIDSAPNLKYVVVPAVGYEWVDYKYAATKGIKVINCPTHNSHAVAEHAIALLFAVARRIRIASESLTGGKWTPSVFEGVELQGKRLGLVGYGNIGKNIADMARGLSMEVSYVNSKSSPQELDEILVLSDVVIVCVSLNNSTKNLLNAARLKLIKPTAILINVARGAIIDEEALAVALKGNSIAGAGLDVFENEPLVGQPPQSAVELAILPNVVATPHIGYNTFETAERLGEELFKNLEACLKDRPINVVSQ